MEQNEAAQTNGTQDGLYLAGGLALIVFGAGLILTNPLVRQYVLGQLGGGNLLEAALPDLERYLKIRTM